MLISDSTFDLSVSYIFLQCYNIPLDRHCVWVDPFLHNLANSTAPDKTSDERCSNDRQYCTG